jgi:hypothetical protein
MATRKRRKITRKRRKTRRSKDNDDQGRKSMYIIPRGKKDIHGTI